MSTDGQTLEQHWGNVTEILDRWLIERRELLVKYGELGEIKTFDGTQQLGGLLTLITMVVLLTGIIGIIVAQAIFALTGIVDERWQGLILGIACHAIGTAKAFEKSQRCGAFSTIGMGLNGIWSSAFLPSLIGLFLA